MPSIPSARRGGSLSASCRSAGRCPDADPPFGVGKGARKAGTPVPVTLDHDPVGSSPRAGPRATKVFDAQTPPSQHVSDAAASGRGRSHGPGRRSRERKLRSGRAAPSRQRQRPLVQADMRGGAGRLRQLRCPDRDRLRRRAARFGQPACERPRPGAVCGRLWVAGRFLDRNGRNRGRLRRSEHRERPGGLQLQYGLPCTGDGCFKKVDQNGGTNYPAPDSGWALEIALDVETVHGICPGCKILLVEANSNSFADLGLAENEAVALGADVVSNSWGGGE